MLKKAKVKSANIAKTVECTLEGTFFSCGTPLDEEMIIPFERGLEISSPYDLERYHPPIHVSTADSGMHIFHDTQCFILANTSKIKAVGSPFVQNTALNDKT